MTSTLNPDTMSATDKRIIEAAKCLPYGWQDQVDYQTEYGRELYKTYPLKLRLATGKYILVDSYEEHHKIIQEACGHYDIRGEILPELIF